MAAVADLSRLATYCWSIDLRVGIAAAGSDIESSDRDVVVGRSAAAGDQSVATGATVWRQSWPLESVHRVVVVVVAGIQLDLAEAIVVAVGQLRLEFGATVAGPLAAAAGVGCITGLELIESFCLLVGDLGSEE